MERPGDAGTLPGTGQTTAFNSSFRRFSVICRKGREVETLDGGNWGINPNEPPYQMIIFETSSHKTTDLNLSVDWYFTVCDPDKHGLKVAETMLNKVFDHLTASLLSSHIRLPGDVEESVNSVLRPVTPRTDGRDKSSVASGDEDYEEKDDAQGGDTKSKGTRNWTLQVQLKDLQRCSMQIQDNLIKPTTILGDMMYKSIAIRDARQSPQLNSSMWRLSWITFIFLPLTFMVGFFGMNVDTFANNPSIKWYFVAVIPMMILIMIAWFSFKRSHHIGRSRRDMV